MTLVGTWELLMSSHAEGVYVLVYTTDGRFTHPLNLILKYHERTQYFNAPRSNPRPSIRVSRRRRE